MKIDNTMFSMYMRCPSMYYERYEVDNSDVQRSQDGRGLVQIQTGPDVENAVLVGPVLGGQGIELDKPAEGRDFGTRMHQLLHERRLGFMGLRGPGFQPSAEWPDESIESEAQATLAAYEAHYVRDFEYLESERTSAVPCLRGCPKCGGEGLPKLDLQQDQRVCRDCGEIFRIHELIVKLDAVVRYPDKTIGPLDTKTESRQGYNDRKNWAGKTQGKLYLYALKALYPNETVSRLVVDVITRGSPKQRRGPLFTRVDDISSTPEAIAEAVKNVNYIADNIELHRKTGWWPSNMNACKRGWEQCDYYTIHVEGRTAENLKMFKPAEQYLEI